MNEHKKRVKSMCRAIRIAWTSLKSHLQYAVTADPSDNNTDADELFHAQAICEYAQQIQICAVELRHLNLERKKSGETTKEESLQKPDSGCSGSAKTGNDRADW